MNATTTDGAALLRAIIDDPDDDLVRLAYADWLEEAGDDARAEFIRVQVAGGGEVYVGGEVWMEPQEGRAAELCRRHSREWAGPPPGHDPLRWEWTFRRGFVEEVRCPLAAWDAHGGSILVSHPVTRVELTDKAPVALNGGYGWMPVIGGGDRGQLPWALADLLPEKASDWWGGGILFYRCGDTKEAAVDVLSEALLARAKEEARLIERVIRGDPDAQKPAGIITSPTKKRR